MFADEPFEEDAHLVESEVEFGVGSDEGGVEEAEDVVEGDFDFDFCGEAGVLYDVESFHSLF